eukprot:CAMPEP_0172329500 /NCGR_PEP_ID=MMETSP1058-20130122/60916_1 /TAXON_ID=83371 /ORGANISM="Detonula confervacea, Strain CCMP 353" /LENGTH=2101 /DNA_ID=CAMNT_0013046679 /DNA_START=37 /DNA_END=6342 /DNA_ORIENTATION=-
MASSTGKPPPPKVAPPPPSPTLDTCIKSVISLGRNAAAPSTRNQADLIDALIGYCIHLARDQDTIASFLRSGKDFPDGSPFSEMMPAINAILTDPALFQCVLSLLSYNPNTGLTSVAQNANLLPPGSSYQQKQGRKRSPSEDAAHIASRKKPMLSPTPTNRLLPKQASKTSMVASDEGSKGQLSEKSIPVFAATIIYSIMQHIDHWPVQIMKAFAEDSFGPRNWVDDGRCKALVSNLEISLEPKTIDGNLDDQSASVAEHVEAYFSSLIARASTIKTSMLSSSKPLNGTTVSSSQHKTISSKEKRKQAEIVKPGDGSSSSSSGEEEVLESESLPTENKQKTVDMESSGMSAVPSTSSLPHPSISHLHNMFSSSSIAKKRVCPRYHMHSLDLAYKAISDAFQDRLNSKSRQNSRLLQLLPSFLSIPRVRFLASCHLERWLQSPALAGLARNLFANIVQELSCVEPPLPDDMEIIDKILKLNLKANQLSMHIEHVTMIAKNIPTQNVAQLIFTHCLQGECSSGSISNALKPNDDHLRMLRSVYAMLDRKLAANALASSVSSLSLDVLNPVSETSDLSSQLQNISYLLCAVVDALGPLYDGFHFVKAIIKAQSGMSKTMTSVTTSARLIFECSLLVTRTVPSLHTALEAASKKSNKKSSFSDFDSVDGAELDCFRKNMLGLRKAILRWCITDVCHVYHGKVSQEEQARCADAYFERGAVTRGPGAPDYHSVLDVHSSPEEGDCSSPFQRMIALVRCMLFLSLPSSKEMETFAMSGEGMEYDRFQRINFCCIYGVDVDDKVLQMIISSPHITPNTALSVIENLLLRCGSKCAAKVSCNVTTVSSLYQLAEYVPEWRSDLSNNSVSPSSNENGSNTSADEANDIEKMRENGGASTVTRLDKSKLPRLAITSLWWRVSSIALILSGVLPEKVGFTMWEEMPTLRALIRMTTSQKYRFPTADCNKTEKERVRHAEERVRQEEANIAELLFMPPQPKKISKPIPQILSPTYHRGGLRSSARQKEKNEKSMAVEEERQAAALHAENMKLRNFLRTLQKNIMVWDPKQEQRKPPKGSIDLLLSVNDRFGLAEKFRLSTSPDFLLQTIGEGRSSIERAYDWLIPIISSHPAIIDRLPPSASCFLLLRAYGVEGDMNRELLDLTAPLRTHVTKCLSGEFGEHHALLAMELLLQDISDESDDRRRCARKVLQEAVGNANVLDSSQFQRLGHCGWLFQMVHIKNCKEIIPLAIKYLSRAIAYERGKVLSMYISALSAFKKFLEEHKMEEDFDFVSTLCELIAARPHVCSDAFDRFPHLRVLALAEVKNAFEQAIESNDVAQRAPASSLVVVTIPRKDGSVTNTKMSSNLLHAAIIIIGNWRSRDHDKGEAQNLEEETLILHLLGYLIIPFTNQLNGNTVSGLSSAKHMHSEKRAVSVEEWVLLAKARAENVAKHAALSAPNIFLPRLLLCCGMPRTSFYTMLTRLDTMLDSFTDSEKIYEELISPAAVSEWGLPGIGSRRTIKRKLHGRILAYMRIHAKHATEREAQELNTAEKSPFVTWLSSEISRPENTQKSHSKSQAPTGITNNLKSYRTDSFDSDHSEDLMEEEDAADHVGDVWSRDDSNKPIDRPVAPNETVSQDFVKLCVGSDQYNVLEESLDLITAKSIYKDIEGASAAAKALLVSYKSFHGNHSFIRILLKWVPLLTQDHGDENLWQLVFIEESEQIQDWCHLMSLVCKCALEWSDEHTTACREWIVSQQTKYSSWKTACSLGLVLRFLVVSSEQKSIHCFDYDDNAHLHFPYAQSQEGAISLTNLALYYVSIENGGASTNGPQNEEVGRALDRRNALPDWLILIMMVGKSHQALVSRLVLEKIDENRSALALSSVVLRMYIMFPLKMNLSDSKLRNTLLQASNDHLPWWTDWRCPLDGQVSEMLSNLTKSPHHRLVQSVADIAKQHPLIFVRHLHFISRKLLEDGSGRDSDHRSLMKRGRIFGKHPLGDAVAQVRDQTVKVVLVLWGYSFNEPVWTSILDVLMTLPVEVLFSCGAKIGLTEVLEAYLRLFAVQIVELNSGSNTINIRDKFMKLIESFRKCEGEGFEDWLQQNDNVRQLLSVADIGV